MYMAYLLFIVSVHLFCIIKTEFTLYFTCSLHKMRFNFEKPTFNV